MAFFRRQTRTWGGTSTKRTVTAKDNGGRGGSEARGPGRTKKDDVKKDFGMLWKYVMLRGSRCIGGDA